MASVAGPKKTSGQETNQRAMGTSDSELSSVCAHGYTLTRALAWAAPSAWACQHAEGRMMVSVIHVVRTGERIVVIPVALLPPGAVQWRSGSTARWFEVSKFTTRLNSAW